MSLRDANVLSHARTPRQLYFLPYAVVNWIEHAVKASKLNVCQDNLLGTELALSVGPPPYWVGACLEKYEWYSQCSSKWLDSLDNYVPDLGATLAHVAAVFGLTNVLRL